MSQRRASIYECLPAQGQNVGLSVAALKYRWDRLGPGFQQEVRAFRERERWAEDQMADHIADRLRAQLLRAYREVPYYRAQWAHAGIEEGDLTCMDPADLRRLPTTPKSDLRTDPEAFLSRRPGRPRRLLSATTSGSTGTPTRVYFTPRNMRQFTAAREVRSYGWAGVSIALPRSTIGARPIVLPPERGAPYYRYNYAERQVYFSAFHLAKANVGDYVEGFNRRRPQVMTGLAHAHFLLAHLMLEAGLKLAYRPRAAIMNGEALTDHMRETIQRAFNTRVFEEYGSVENCILATECEEGSLHVSSDLGLLEVVDDTGRPVPAGHHGRFVCTGLLNEAQPLVRYEIGDLGILSPERCSCGRHLPRLAALVGRERDAFLMRDGRLVPTVGDIFAGIAEVVEGQIVQNDYEVFTIKVVTERGFGSEQETQLNDALRAKLGDVRVHVQSVETLERTNAGKFRPMVAMSAEHGNRGPLPESALKSQGIMSDGTEDVDQSNEPRDGS